MRSSRTLDGADPHGFVAYVEQHASQYVDDVDSAAIRVRLVAQQKRSRSSMYVICLEAGPLQRLILVKVSDPVRRTAIPKDGSFVLQARPYLSSAVEPAEPTAMVEHRGLALAHEHLSRNPDPRLGSIRPLDYLPEQRAIIMEYVSHPTLRSMVARASRLGRTRSPEHLRSAFSNAGAWLRMYHDLPYGNAVPFRRATRSEFAETISTYGRYLARALNDEDYFCRLRAFVEERTAEALPHRLPLGLGHGDYAARNVFVGDGDRVTAFDAMPRLRVPIYEDLARFILSVRSAGIQVVSMGKAYDPRRLDEFETSFLNGYFPAGGLSVQSIRLYQVLILLDKWAALVSRSGSGRLRHRIKIAARLAVLNRHYRAEAARLLRALGTA